MYVFWNKSPRSLVDPISNIAINFQNLLRPSQTLEGILSLLNKESTKV